MERTFCTRITQSNRDRKVHLQMVYLVLKFCALKPGFLFLKGLFRMNAIPRKMRYQENENVYEYYNQIS
jgi:hypothetical protein